MSLTAKGRFVLDCLGQGINTTYAEYDRMWLAANEAGTVSVVCPRCHGIGYITKDNLKQESLL